MKTLQQLKDSGEWEVFVDESIVRPELIRIDDTQYATNLFGEVYQLYFKVTLVKVNPGTDVQTSLGPIQQRTVNIDDVRYFTAEGPYFRLMQNTPSENRAMVRRCRENLWLLDMTNLPNKLSRTPALYKL